MKRYVLIIIFCACFLGSVFLPVAAEANPTLKPVYVSSNAIESNSHSYDPVLSADGRIVAFYSYASNLVSGDTNNTTDIFVTDRQTGITERVSVSSTGTQGNNESRAPALSADGRFVVFYSLASNLVPGDTNHYDDVFVHDRQTGSTERVSVSSTGTGGNDGSTSTALAISPDGRFVTFYSFASNLVPGDTNTFADVFIRDRQTGITERVSVSSAGTQGNSQSYASALSADGRFVTFYSFASNLVPNDTNSYRDVFVHDRQNNTTEQVTVSSTGIKGNLDSANSTISADGRFVAFWSYSTNLVPDDTNYTTDIFVRDQQTGSTERVSVSSTGTESNFYSFDPVLSADGRFVTFYSAAFNLVPDDTNHYNDIFVHDRQTGSTERVSVSFAGTEGNNYSENSAISADGRFVAFHSLASNLVPDDVNNSYDIFVHDRQTGNTERVSVGAVLPASPILLTPANATATTNAKTVFTWSPVPDVDHYEMRLDTVNPPIKIVYSGKLLTYTPPAPLSLMTYYWQVAAIDRVGNISSVETRTITIISPENAAPARNYFTINTPTLTWNRVTTAARYEIQVDDTLNFSSALDFTANVLADQLSVITTSLANNTYYWHVRACPVTGTCGNWSAIDSFVVDS
ncbi:MAG: PD40 domain-containing protein [Anaerolineae bacterium]|nr:PD40 domain-containing protein [Anaerolineae bacterium]